MEFPCLLSFQPLIEETCFYIIYIFDRLLRLAVFSILCDASPDDLRRHGASQSHVFYFRGYGILFLSERNFSEQDFHCLRIQLPCQAFCSSERITVQKSTTGRCGCIAATGRNFCLACDTGSLLVSTAVFTEEIFP